MATLIHQVPVVDGAQLGSYSGGKGPTEGQDGCRRDRPTPRRSSSSGIWLAFCAIAMSFAAFSSALVVRQGSTDWQHIHLPSLLYLNTLTLVASSITIEIARKRTATFMRTAGVSQRRPMGWMVATLTLGLLFVAGQIAVWHRLAASNLYIATNPNSSFLYLLTGFHALHVLGGLVAIAIVIYRLHGAVPTLRKQTLVATCLYWHFMGVLWVYLLLLLRTQI